MPVFYIHDVGQGRVTPLDRKFRIRDIRPAEEVTATEHVHFKNDSDASEYETPSQHEQKNQKAAHYAAQQYTDSQSEVDAPNPFSSLGLVKDIMSSPVLTINREQSLADAWRMMEKYEIHHLIVVDDNQAYCGMLSEKKIVPFLMANSGGTLEGSLPETTPLSVFCNENLLSTHPETSVSDLAPALLEYGLDSIAVTEGGRVSGVVTYSDVLKIILKSQSFEAKA